MNVTGDKYTEFKRSHMLASIICQAIERGVAVPTDNGDILPTGGGNAHADH